MKKMIVLLLGVICFYLGACSSQMQTHSNDQQQETNQEIQMKESMKEQTSAAVSEDELCGVYVSALDENVTFIFTQDEHTLDERGIFVTSPVYKCRRGEEKQALNVYSWEIEGNILTVVDWFGSTIPYEIIKDNNKLQLKFLEDQYSFSVYDGDCKEFLSDLTKVTTE